MSSYAEATSVIVIYKDHQLFVGADGKRSESAGNHGSKLSDMAPTSHCKVQQYGTIFVAHAGPAQLLFEGESGGPATTALIDIQPSIDRAIETPGGLEAKADSLDRSFWPAYQSATAQIEAAPLSALRTNLMDLIATEEFLLIGFGEDGQPEAIVLNYWKRFSNWGKAQQMPYTLPPHRVRKEVPQNSGYAIGWGDAYSKSSPSFGQRLATTSPLQMPVLIREFLTEETRLHPDQVFPPYSVIKLSASGLSVISAGSCQFSPIRQQPKHHSR